MATRKMWRLVRLLLILNFEIGLLTGCVPSTTYRLKNSSTASISAVGKESLEDKIRKQKILLPGETTLIGQWNLLTIKTNQNRSYSFFLPDRILKWVPRELPDGRFRYDLSEHVGDSLSWKANPPSLEPIISWREITLEAGKSKYLPTASVGFPLFPIENLGHLESAEKAFFNRQRTDIFRVGRELENMMTNNPETADKYEPINWSQLNRVFSRP